MPAPIGLNIKNKLEDMQIGDCIPCRYTASTSGSAGSFSELGTCTASEIPVTGTPAPDGLFYFIKTAKGTLIADRVIQTSISWDTLNSAKFIEGQPFMYETIYKKAVPTLSTYTNGIITVSASADGNGAAWQAFDNNDNTYWQPEYSIAGRLPILYIDFKNPIYINSYSIRTPSGYAPRNFTFEGSSNISNDANWVVLDTQNNISWTGVEEKQFSIPSHTTMYRYYRLKITALDGVQQQVIMYSFNMETYDSLSKLALVRSLSGGCAYVDANGNMSTTDKGLGAFPSCNEWDKYIVNSDLNGKITKGGDNIWHWKNLNTACKDTTITSIKTNNFRCFRGISPAGSNNPMWQTSNVTSPYFGFRPVLEYIEPDGSSKQATLWY